MKGAGVAKTPFFTAESAEDAETWRRHREGEASLRPRGTGLRDEGPAEPRLKLSLTCRQGLELLPTNYPLFDLQCSACSFRAQVKTNESKPKDVIRGAGWEVMNKVTKAGYLVPPLIANFKWKEQKTAHQVILFFPFIPKTNLKKYSLSEEHKYAGYRMFNYTGLARLPAFLLYNAKNWPVHDRFVCSSA